MRNILRGILAGFFILCTILITADAFAGAWTVPHNRLYTELYLKYYWHSSEFRDNNRRYGWGYDGQYHEKRIELKLEYGINDKLNALLYIPYKEGYWKQVDNKYNASGFADYVVGLKYRWFEKPFVFSTQATAKIPGEIDKDESPNIHEYANITPEVRLLFGKSFSKIPSYIGYEWSWIAPQDIYTDQIRNFFEVGYYPLQKLMLKAEYEGLQAVPHQMSRNVAKSYMIYRLGFVYNIKGGFGQFRTHQQGTLINWEVAYENTFRGRNSGAAEAIITKLAFLF